MSTGVFPKTTRRPDGAAFVIAAHSGGHRRIGHLLADEPDARAALFQQRVGPTVFPYIVASGLGLPWARPDLGPAQRPGPRQDDYIGAHRLDRGWPRGANPARLHGRLQPWRTGVLFACTARAFGYRGPLWQTCPSAWSSAFIVWFMFDAACSFRCRQGPLETLLVTGSFYMNTFELSRPGPRSPPSRSRTCIYALIGVTLGTAVGVLPGIGPALTVALLLPVTYGLDPAGSLIMFAGIYYGGMYGGSTTSILLNTPGESASIVTALEGNKMARKGQGRSGTGDRGHRVLRRRADRHAGPGLYRAASWSNSRLSFGRANISR
jgi:hypothetical protein